MFKKLNLIQCVIVLLMVVFIPFSGFHPILFTIGGWLGTIGILIGFVSIKMLSKMQKNIEYRLKMCNICFQDELLNSWKRKKSKHKFSFGKQVQHGILGRVKDKLKKNGSNIMLESSVPTTQTCPECGSLTKHSLDKRKYHCIHCGFKNADRDIHSANMMVLLSGYGTYRSLNTDTVSTKKMVGLLDCLSNLGVVVTTNSMEAHCL